MLNELGETIEGHRILTRRQKKHILCKYKQESRGSNTGIRQKGFATKSEKKKSITNDKEEHYRMIKR